MEKNEYSDQTSSDKKSKISFKSKSYPYSLNDNSNTDTVTEDIFIYEQCKHMINLYSNRYHPVLNQMHSPISNYHKKEDVNVLSYKNIEKNYIGHIVNKWTAFHNDTSLNHTVPHTGEGCIFSLEFSKNGKFLASTNHFGKIEIWNIYKKKLERQLSIHKDIVTGIEIFRRDVLTDNLHLDSEFEDEYLLSSSLDKTIKLSKNGKILNEFTKHNDWIKSISLSKDKNYFLSGCVSSKIKYWDLNEGKVCFEFDNSINSEEEMLKTQNSVNTVNSLHFFDSGNLFVSGFRNGYIKVFDVRAKNLSFSFFAHENKLNSVKLSKSNDYFLSCGRDSLGKLWDIRRYESQISTYSNHKSKSFNIEFNFFNKETMAITGSEDSKIYIYDLNTGCLSNEFITDERCCNIVKPLPEIYSNKAFVFSGLDNLHLKFCEFSEVKSKKVTQNLKDNDAYFSEFKKDSESKKLFNQNDSKDESRKQDTLQEMMEEILTENGDAILNLIHKNNLTCNNQVGMENLMELFSSGSNDSSNTETRDLLMSINSRLIQKFSERARNSEKKKKKDVNSTTEVLKEKTANIVKVECTKCKDILNEKSSLIEERIDINTSNISSNEINEINNFFDNFEEMFTLPISNSTTALNI